MEVDEKIDGNGTTVDFSSIRGKKALVSPSHEQFDLLKKLLEKRIIDSGGETIFEIGSGDNEENGLEADEYAASVCIYLNVIIPFDLLLSRYQYFYGIFYSFLNSLDISQ